MKKKVFKIAGFSLLGILLVVLVFAKVNRVTPLGWSHPSINQPMFSDEAINGYDVVAYFTEGKAVKGDKAYSHRWKDADWYFASEEHAKQFAENPDQYVPSYGGYCAFAVSKGFTANTSPESFELIDGKLYFFADEKVRKTWMSDLEANRKKSNNNWR